MYVSNGLRGRRIEALNACVSSRLLLGKGQTSYILAEVESSDNGAELFANYLLTIADCRRSIRLEFFLGTKENRHRSLKKNNLLDTLTRFRDALKRESDLIEKFKAD